MTAQEPPTPEVASQDIEDASGCALDRFHRALARAARVPGLVRVVHLGDSHVASDHWTGEIRRRLQAEHGVGGPGLFVPGRPWRSHRHADLRLRGTGRWKAIRMTRGRPEDGVVGLSGVALVSTQPGATLFVEPEPSARGAATALVRVHFVRQPGGGRLGIRIDDAAQVSFSTAKAGGTPSVDTWEALVTDGLHRVEVRHTTGGPVRVLGLALERAAGVVYDALGVNGARLTSLDRADQAAQAEELSRRAPALVVFGYGTNEVDDRDLLPEDVTRLSTRTLHRLRAAAPDAACIVVGPPDRAALLASPEDEGGADQTRVWTTHPRLPAIVDALRAAARASGCGFWDTFTAMGGEGSIARWAELRPAFAGRDRIHLTVAGYRLLGDAFADALLASHARWIARRTPVARQGRETQVRDGAGGMR